MPATQVVPGSPWLVLVDVLSSEAVCNRMRCKTGDGETWATVCVKEMRKRLGLAEDDGFPRTEETMISSMKAAESTQIDQVVPVPAIARQP